MPSIITKMAQGFAGGLMGGAILIFIGALLSLTGIGAIIGVPLIIAGVLCALLGPLSAFTRIDAPCPYCGTDIITSSTKKGVTCKACEKRIVIRDKQLIRID